MLADVIEVKVLDGYRLFLRFEDGLSGEVDISKIVPFKGIFKELQDRKYFKNVSINEDIGTIYWENGADLSPCTLHKIIEQQHH